MDNDKQKLPLSEYIAAWLIATIAGIFMIMASSCKLKSSVDREIDHSMDRYECLEVNAGICLCEQYRYDSLGVFTIQCDIVDKWRVDKQEARDE